MRRHHRRIKRRLAAFAAIGAGDLGKVNFVAHHAQHKAGQMAFADEIRHRHGSNNGSSIFQGRNVLLMPKDRI
jgi:hypothetical protein